MNNDKKTHLTTDELWDCIDSQIIPSAMEKHMSSCSECNELLTELQSIHSDLKELSYDDPSMAFSRRVVEEWESSKVRFPWFIAAVTTVFALLFGMSIYLSVKAELEYSTEVVQLSSFVIIVCLYRLYGLVGDKRRKMEFPS